MGRTVGMASTAVGVCVGCFAARGGASLGVPPWACLLLALLAAVQGGFAGVHLQALLDSGLCRRDLRRFAARVRGWQERPRDY